jgi:hypothetical protein
MDEACSHTFSRPPRSFATPSALVLLAAPDVQLSNWARRSSERVLGNGEVQDGHGTA